MLSIARLMRRVVGLGSIVVILAALSTGSAHAAGAAPVPPKTPLSCAALTTLRNLASRLTLFTNPGTGDKFEYAVLGDAAKSNDVIVMFPGTGEIIPDWPVQMITNQQASPRIAATFAYLAAQDGPVSLCHDYHLVLFDYPGVGNGVRKAALTGDRIAADVDAMLDNITARYHIPTNVVDPLGWSLGTHLALKFSLVSPAADPARTINNIILIGTRPGGETGGYTNGNQAACVVSLLNAAQSPHINHDFARHLDADLFRLTFPYVGQQPYSGVDSGCHAEINTETRRIALNVEMDCPAGSACSKNLFTQVINRLISPWRKTGGISPDVYRQERGFDHDWNTCHCPTAGPDFTSTGCTCAGPVQQSARDGGMCQTAITGAGTANGPVSTGCASLRFAGRLTVINAREDLFIQWTYGRALVRGMQQALGADKARLVTYPGSAGHAVLMQYPAWTQQQIADAMRN